MWRLITTSASQELSLPLGSVTKRTLVESQLCIYVIFFFSATFSFHCVEVRHLCALTSHKYTQVLTSFCGSLVSRSRPEHSLVSPVAQGGKRQGVAR